MAALDPAVALPLSRWSATETADPAAGLPPLDDLVYRRREGDPIAPPALDDLVHRQQLDIAPGVDLMDALRSSFAPPPAGPHGLPPGAMPVSAGAAGPSEAEQAARIRGAERGAIGGGWAPGAPPPWASSPPATPTLPDPDAMPWDAAGSERFAPEHDADPLARAAEQQAEDAAAEQARIDAQAAEYDRLDPVTFADVKAKQALKIEHERATRELAAAETDRQQLEANVKRRELATAAAQRELADVTAKAKGMADSSPFESWWSSRSAPQQFAGIVAGIFGGLNSTRTGGRNSAIDMFKEIAESDAAAKWKKLDARRGLAQDALANAGADFRERETIRVASYEQVARGIEAQLALLDPQGSQAIKLSEVHRGVRAQQAEALRALEKEAFDRADKMIARDQEQQRIDIERAKAEEAARLARAKAAAAASAGAASKQVFPPEYYKAKYRLTDDQVPTVPMTEKDFRTSWVPIMGDLVRQEKTQSDAKIADQGSTRDKEVDARKLSIGSMMPTLVDGEGGKKQLVYGDLTQADGSQFLAPTDTEAGEIRKVLGSTTTAVQLIDDLVAMRKKYGWSSDTVKSPEWRRMKSTFGTLTMENKDSFGLGALAGPDVAALAEVAGTSDPTEVRDPTPGLLEMRKNLLGRADNRLRAARYTGRKFIIPTPTRAKLAPRDPDVDKAASEGKGGGMLDPVQMKIIGGVLAAGGLSNVSAGMEGTREAIEKLTPDERARMVSGLTLTQYEGMKALVGKTRDGDPDAAQSLETLATSAKTPPNVRRAAFRALVRLGMDGNSAALSLISEQDDYTGEDGE